MNEIVANMSNCSWFPKCNKNWCPLDPEMKYRHIKRWTEKCRFLVEPYTRTIKGKVVHSGGSLMPDTLLKKVPMCNVEHLNERSKNRWNELFMLVEK